MQPSLKKWPKFINNRMSRIEKFCLKFLEYGIYASLLAPAIVFPFSVYPYLYGKALFINILSALLLPVYVLLLYLRPELKPKKNPLVLMVILFFGVLFLSTIFGFDARHSFWGTQERSAGVFFLLHYLLLFFISGSIFRDKKSWRKLIIFSLMVSVVIIGSAWWDIAMDKIFNPGAGTRTGGALSNVIFYAAYLLLHIPLAAWLFLESKNKWSKVILFIVFILENISFFYTRTRGAILGYLSMVVAIFLILPFVKRKYLKFTALGALLLLIFFTSIFIFRNARFIKKNPFLGSIANISTREITAKTRLEAWNIAIKGFVERPVLGWGQENYYAVFNKFYNPQLLRFSYAETWSDKPHSILFEILVTTGVLGVITYFGVYVVIFSGFLKKLLRHQLSPRSAIPLSLIFIGYLVQNLFSIDTVSTYLVLFILFSFSSFMLFSDDSTRLEVKRDTNKPIPGAYLSVLVALVLSVISIWQWAVEPAYAGYLTAKATAVKTFGDALPLWQRAISIKTPWSYDAQVEYLKGITRLAQNASNNEYRELNGLLLDSEKVGKQLTANNSKNAYYNYLFGRFYTEWGKFDPYYFKEAKKYFDKSIELSPKRQQLYYGLGRMYLLSGEIGSAISTFSELVKFDEDVDESHWFYGIALRYAGRGEEAYEEIKKALYLGYSPISPEEVFVLAEVATKEKDLDALERVYEDAIRIDPKNADWYARLAALYLQIGKEDKARELVIKAVILDPTLKEEAAKFIKLLE